MHGFLYLTLVLQLQQWLVIYVDYCLLSHQIMLPLIHNLHQGIDLLLIGRVVNKYPIKYFKMVAYEPSSLHQDHFHSIPSCIFLLFKGLLLLPLVVMAWSGTTTIENKAMKLLKHYANPTKLLTLETLVCNAHFMMVAILERSIFSSPPPITYPRYTKYCCANSYFLRFSSIWCFFNVSSTCIKCMMCSS